MSIPEPNDEASSVDGADGAAKPPQPAEAEDQHEVALTRSVRYGRIIVVAAAAGAIIAGIVAFCFPVAPDADYELGQAVGLALVVGAVIGLTLGSILSLVLGAVAKRNRGAALAIHRSSH